MRKLWLAGVTGLALGIGMATGTGLLTQAGANQVVVEPGWRYFDGYWNYWDADDGAWYHTDGKHWYGYSDNGWTAYNFDRKFGRKSYREGYVVPKPGKDLVIPRHKVYIAK